jgi:hypothetical protein
MPLTSEQVASATGCDASFVEANWALMQEALAQFDIQTDLVEVAVAATIAVETGNFDFTKHEKMANPLHQPDLAKAQARYSPFYGRGPIELTWHDNYLAAGNAIGVDLVSDPDQACVPENGAKILAWFFKTNHVADAANAQDPLKVRTRVNGLNHTTGKPNGWEAFEACYNKLLALIV